MNKSLNNLLNKDIKKKNLFFFLVVSILATLLLIAKADLVGFLSFFFSGIVTFYFSRYYESLSTVLYIALSIRLVTILLGNIFISLPDSWGDATLFEIKAWEWAQDGFFVVLSKFANLGPSYFISWLLAIFYSLTDRSVIMGQTLSVMFGMGSILIGSRIAYKIYDERISIKVGWILALYPTFILYSCLILREAYVWFFLLTALYGIVCWFKDGSFKSLFIASIGFSLATLYHGGMFIGGFIFLIIISLTSIIQFIHKIINLKISIKLLVIVILSSLSLVYILLIADNIPKINSIKNLINIDNILITISNRNINIAAYPEWTVPNSLLELVYKTPIRIIYFLFSPFPWDVNKSIHLIGLLDGIFHLILFIFLIKNFKSIWGDPILRTFTIILISYLLLFGVSIGNFGTGIRHRTKFLIIIILLVIPWLPNLSFNKKNK